MAQTLPKLQEGLQLAIEESIKNERMKTELITNVSHDIKTPLTSIINYVDLLKRAKPQGENVEHYLEVLAQKSERLKHLIEDLVEASKASSGTISLEKTNLDFTELVSQTVGEFEEKLAGRKLRILVNMPDPPVTIFADGRRMFRILENLFQNVYKYAQEGTRVYLDLEVLDGKTAVLTLRNISAAALNISAEELTERFVRGEESRSSEGSGLGLSIAKDLVKLQGGELTIWIDGDLFKVEVRFPMV
jgi:signal transduction histidine kinase